jgi:glycosyltransferase involved in cell wall biosynthesis
MMLQLLAPRYPDLRVVVPADAQADLGLPAGITVVRRGRMRGHAWEQLTLPRELGANDVLFSPANTGPLRVERQALVVHDLAFHHHPEWFDPRFARWYAFVMPRLVRRVRAVVTVSEAVRTDLIRTYTLPAEKVHVVPPFADASQFPAPVPTHAPERFFLFVGHDDPRKDVRRGLDLLFQADPEARAVVVGRQRRSFARVAPPDDHRVTWLTDATDGQLAWLYDHAQALLFPSRYEGSGLPVLEALQRGCPVVARPLPVYHEQFGTQVIACGFTGSADLSAVLPRIRPRVVFPSVPDTATDRFTPTRSASALITALSSLMPS